MKRGKLIAGVVLMVSTVMLAPLSGFAEVPGQINFQGRLTDGLGAPVADGQYGLGFSLYYTASGGSALWSEVQTVWVAKGIFSVALGQPGNEMSADLFTAGLYLGVTVGSDAEMIPRLPLNSVAFAFKAAVADTVGGFAAGDFLTRSAPAVIAISDGGYALSVTNTGTGGAANLQGFVNVDRGNLLVRGNGSFDSNGEEGILYLGDSQNYIKAVHGSGVSIGTFNADDALVVKQGTGNVGVGIADPSSRLDVRGLISSRGTGLDGGLRLANPVGGRDYRVIQKNDGRFTITDETAAQERIIVDANGNVGIGTLPSQRLSVNGTIESVNGGFKFPDGTSQASAGSSPAYVSALEARIASLESKMAALENVLANVTRSGSDITFSGVNVHVVNGTGTTTGPPNGVGNLIVGYNQVRGTGDDRTGSHNIVVGDYNNYSSYGGLVAGRVNTISGAYASVSGGGSNTASGYAASVSGGEANTASGGSSSVSGGRTNTASGYYSSVSGGTANTASETYSSVSGGTANRASGGYSSVSGGDDNTASGAFASVSGGRTNTASGYYSSVSGGYTNTASEAYSSVSGGRYNAANGESSSVSGGSFRFADGDYDWRAGELFQNF